jgi:uncharacterized protein YciI
MWHLTIHRWVGDQAQAAATHLEAHLAWTREQQLAGRILAAGPTRDRSLGIMLHAHMSEDDVHALCRTDPFVSSGFRSYEVIPWDVRHAFGIDAPSQGAPAPPRQGR